MVDLLLAIQVEHHTGDGINFASFREFFESFFSVFRCFLAALAPNMHETKCRGPRDLSVVKFSAPYDPWRSNKRRKTKIAKIDKISIKLDENR